MRELDVIQVLSIAHTGERAWAAADHARTVRLVIGRLENELEMPVSLSEKGKTMLLASSTALSKDLENMTRKLGIRTVSRSKHLGVTVCAGRRRIKKNLEMEEP